MHATTTFPDTTEIQAGRDQIRQSWTKDVLAERKELAARKQIELAALLGLVGGRKPSAA